MTVSLQVAMSAVTLVLAVTVWMERDWLAGRVIVLTPIVGFVLASLWWPSRCDESKGRWRSDVGLWQGVVVAVAGLVGAVVAGTDLSSVDDSLAAAWLGSSVPPARVYALTIGFASLAVAGARLAVLVVRRPASVATGRRAPVVIGVVLAGLVLAVVGVAGGALGSRSDVPSALSYRFEQPPQPLDDVNGPAEVETDAWSTDSYGDESAPVVVPGWDTLLFATSPTRLRAVSRTDGSEQWAYDRADAAWSRRRGDRQQGDRRERPESTQLAAVTADAGSERVLLVVEDDDGPNAAVVLSLRDGREVATVALPDELACEGAPGDGASRLHDMDLQVTASSAAVVACHYRNDDSRWVLAVVDVATGRVRELVEPTGEDCDYAAAAVADTTYVVEQGGEMCGVPPTLFAVPADGPVERLGEVAGPDHEDEDFYFEATCAGNYQASCISGTSDSVVLHLETPSTSRIVALELDGSPRWSTSASYDAFMYAGGDRVLVHDFDILELLEHEEGRGLATTAAERSLSCEDGPPDVTADSEGVYVRCDDTLSVLDADDLSMRSSFELPSRANPTGSPITLGDGVVIVQLAGWEDRARWVAFGPE